jgi:hypothetical protein
VEVPQAGGDNMKLKVDSVEVYPVFFLYEGLDAEPNLIEMTEDEVIRFRAAMQEYDAMQEMVRQRLDAHRKRNAA